MKGLTPVVLALCVALAHAGVYRDRFLEQYKKIAASDNNYFSPEGIPYHSLETLMIESVDYGHETDSEALSYNIWLKAMYGAIAGDFQPFNKAWSVIEDYMIPTLQPSNSLYTPESPGVVDGMSVGQDPIFDELKAAYDTDDVFVMHWLSDVDNRYGFGNGQGVCEQGPDFKGPSFVNNGPGGLFQGITFPSCDNFTYGGEYGFQWYGATSPAWQYAAAPDAEARSINAAFWAAQWAREQGKLSEIEGSLAKTAQMADHLRYSLYDKHFKKVGNCIGKTDCPAGKGKESAHYLISWYIGWGGSLELQYGWSWRMGSSEAHVGYQNPVAAFALVNETTLRPKGASAVEDWQNSLERQLELYKFLQTEDGPLAGGVTNSWNSNYEEPPAEVKENTFHGMYYIPQPGYEGSSDWLGMQSWSVDRLAQYYYLTGDSTAEEVVGNWVNWVLKYIKITSNSYSVPTGLSWSGNVPNARATVSGQGENVGIASSIARTLIYYAAKSGNEQAKQTGKDLLDRLWELNRDDKGLSITSTLGSYNGFASKVYIPQEGWTGVYPNGEIIDADSTFIGIRSWYRDDPDFAKVQTYINGGPAPQFNYHRFWEQADVALALGAYGLLFEES